MYMYASPLTRTRKALYRYVYSLDDGPFRPMVNVDIHQLGNPADEEDRNRSWMHAIREVGTRAWPRRC